ncbi:hypothetical protein SKAU_G00380470 [Synaphobranchus kaupii]|uniref:Uncharacterized protein n=1 Tax=Synaphobranchus kaupii TaxID=118154 RepID=A0A9Q1IEL6_SYNKA|nr:hypothetical protein SKAU_G00380470 [Synaphobranchus kaupii]
MLTSKSYDWNRLKEILASARYGVSLLDRTLLMGRRSISCSEGAAINFRRAQRRQVGTESHSATTARGKLERAREREMESAGRKEMMMMVTAGREIPATTG